MRTMGSGWRANLLGWVAAAGLIAALPGCGGDEPAGDGKAADGGSGDGTVVIDGSSTVFRISRAAQQEFAQVDSDVNVIVSSSGTGPGFAKYLAGEVDVVDASRPAKPEEEAKAKEQGIDWHRFQVGYDGISLIVHPKNDFARVLTVEQLAKLWKPDGGAKTWKDLDPSWPDREVKLYSPDEKSGTFEFFTEAITGKRGAQRKDVQASADDNILVRGVAGDVDGIGYLGYAYYQANADKLGLVSVKAKADAPAVAPSPATILDKSYTPLARPLYIYVKKSAYRRPPVAKFVKFYLDKIDELATKAKYVAPTAEDRAANKATLDAADVVTPTA